MTNEEIKDLIAEVEGLRSQIAVLNASISTLVSKMELLDRVLGNFIPFRLVVLIIGLICTGQGAQWLIKLLSKQP